MSDDRWEVGSSFPLVPLPAADQGDAPAYGHRWPRPHRRYGCGRQALRALVAFGVREYGWTALHLPAYYCPEVVDAVAGLVPIRRYAAGPGDPPIRVEATDTEAVVVVSYFGQPPAVPETAGTLVVDATHDPVAPWLADVRAGYVFASLRKTLPLPDGGLLWSPDGRELPPAPAVSPEHLVATGHILSAMTLKAAYLGGASVDKDDYLALYARGEACLRRAPVSGMSPYSAQVLYLLPAARWRARRVSNAALLSAGLAGLTGLDVQAHPFGVVLVLDPADLRDRLCRELVARDVYPAVLWRQEDSCPTGPLALSRRMLHLHTDFRWSPDDMRRVAEIVRAVLTAATNPVPSPASAAPTVGPTADALALASKGPR